MKGLYLSGGQTGGRVVRGQWAVTVPKKVDWSRYQDELTKAEAGELLNFRVPHEPKRVRVGDICYIVNDGRVRGFHVVCGVGYQDGFECSTTGEHWRAGWYIQRTGKFYECDFKMVGFRGYRAVSFLSAKEVEEMINGLH